jgi:hypothetical protein
LPALTANARPTPAEAPTTTTLLPASDRSAMGPSASFSDGAVEDNITECV